ncbi:hypothetical protein [Formosa algae]|uniref:Uncharacterized protein n=1 Tax=Formosa algae TaxID=225843 RepID=A0A9X0YJ58_9FLAO|nr:hypothetical protein [Formosa algae]MBP1839514.1 hypothetical protein [Formosa algae]MDQ0334818.1 hypothetical protein [Formosa algae]OEI82062.1 hypothetical protein AST99_01050 [Formosa algae]PNW27399.1 hypothetical protein BKP44_13290 [Formosa algae]
MLKTKTIATKYTKSIPYLYFISVIICWFTLINRYNGLSAYPILLCSIPFIWQLIKPNNTLNFTLSITFICLSSYLILMFLLNKLHLVNIIHQISQTVMFSAVGLGLNLIMALWILRHNLIEQQ